MLETLSKSNQLQQIQVTVGKKSGKIKKFPFSSPVISVSDLPPTEHGRYDSSPVVCRLYRHSRQ